MTINMQKKEAAVYFRSQLTIYIASAGIRSKVRPQHVHKAR